MKKLISILLCVAMVLSLAAVTFATEDEVEIVLGDNVVTIPQATTDAECWRYISFTPDESGTYVITNTNESSSGLYVYIDPYTWAEGGINYGESKEVELEAGVPYEFAVFSWNAYEGDTDVAFNISKKAESEEGEGGEGGDKVVNETPQEGDNYMLIAKDEASWGKVTVYFIADRDGTYVFECNDENGGYLYMNGDTLYAPKSVNLQEGESVEFQLYNWNADRQDCYISFTITWGELVIVETNDELRLGDNLITWDTGYDNKILEMTVPYTGVYTVTNKMPESWSKLWLNDGSYFYSGESKKVYLEEGQTLKLEMKSEYQEPFALTIEYTEGVIEPDGSSDYPYELPMGDLTLDWEDGDDLYFVYTTPADGVLTITGNLNDCRNYISGGTTLVQVDETTWTMNLYKDTNMVFEFYTYDVDTPVFLTFAFEAGELEPNGTSDFPYDIELGDYTHSFNGDALYYRYTATEDGYLTVITGLDPEGNPFSNTKFSGLKKNYEDGTASVYLYAGQTAVFSIGSYGELDADFDLTFVPGKKVTTGESDDPHRVYEGETQITLTADQAGRGLYYMFIAEKDGTLTVVVPEGGQFYDSSYVMDVSDDYMTATLVMKAGETITFNVWADDALNGAFTVTFQGDGEEGGDVVEPDEPVVPAGDYTFVVFAMMILSMAAIVVLVSKKRNF